MKVMFKKMMLVVGVLLMAACGGDPVITEPGNEEMIIGKWAVENYYLVVKDLTDDNEWLPGSSYTREENYNLPDTSYVGYDSAIFSADKTMQWHMNDRMVSEGQYDYSSSYVKFNWIIDGDTLAINGTKYAIKELDSLHLVFENYYKVNSYQDHHGWERIIRYTFNKVQ